MCNHERCSARLIGRAGLITAYMSCDDCEQPLGVLPRQTTEARAAYRASHPSTDAQEANMRKESAHRRRTHRYGYGDTHEIALRGRRNSKAAPNSLLFLARVEGVTDVDGHVRGANGLRWRLP